MHACFGVRMYVYARTITHVCIIMYVYTYVYTRMYVCVRIRTYVQKMFMYVRHCTYNYTIYLVTVYIQNLLPENITRACIQGKYLKIC